MRFARPALLALLSVACAHARPESPFPKPEALQELGAAPRPSLGLHDVAAVDAWALAGPFPQSAVAQIHSDGSPWQGVLGAWAQQRGGGQLPTEDMHCIAREFGRFYLAKGAFPQRPLEEFIEARCMTSAAHVRTSRLAGEADPSIPDAQLLEKWKPQVEQLLAAFDGDGSRVVGLWFGREGKKAVVMLAGGKREVQLETASVVPDAQGTVLVRGAVLQQNVQTLAAEITQGRFGYARCERDESVQLPRFLFRCPTLKTDAVAQIDVSTFEKGRFLGSAALSLLAFPAGVPQNGYSNRSEVEPARVGGEAAMREGFVGLLNSVRAKAGLSPVELAERQSSVAQQLAPHYVAASTGGAYSENPARVLDLVAMGLMAGWEVQGSVRDGDFGAVVLHPCDDLGQLVSYFIARPTYRAMVLDPLVRQLAVGPILSPKEHMVGALVTGYRLVEKLPQAELQKAFFKRLGAARRSAGKKQVVTVNELMPLAAQAAARLDSGTVSPIDARDDLLQQSVQRTTGGVMGWALEFSSFEDMHLPDELIQQDVLPLAVGIGTYRYPGEPWTRYVALVVTVEASQMQMASAASAGSAGD